MKGKLSSHSAGRLRKDEMFIVVSEWQLSWVSGCTAKVHKGLKSCSAGNKKRRRRRRCKNKTSHEVFCKHVIQSFRFLTAVFSFREEGRSFLQHDFFCFFSCCQSKASCGGAIISEFTSMSRSTLRQVMDVMIWIFLVVFHPTGWYCGPDLHFASVSSHFRCVLCLETWGKKRSQEVRFTSLLFAY